MKDANDVDVKKLREAIASLNGAKLVEKAVVIKGKTTDDMMDELVAAVESLDDDKAAKLPEKVILMYNDLISDEAPEEEEEESEVEEEMEEAEEESEVEEEMEEVEEEVEEEEEKKGTKKEEKENKDTKEKGDVKEGDKPKKTTKKSIIIGLLESKKGGTVEQMAQAITDAGLDDVDKNRRTVKLWLPKIGFKVEKNDKDVYKKKVVC